MAVCANKQMKLQRCQSFCHIIAPTALAVVTWQQESIFSASGRRSHKHPWHFTTMPNANANSNSSVDQVLAAALEGIRGESIVIRSFGANVEDETFRGALRHFVFEASSNTGTLVECRIISPFRLSWDLSVKRAALTQASAHHTGRRWAAEPQAAAEEGEEGCEQVELIITSIHLRWTPALLRDGAAQRRRTFDESPLKISSRRWIESLRQFRAPPFIISLGPWAGLHRPEDTRREQRHRERHHDQTFWRCCRCLQISRTGCFLWKPVCSIPEAIWSFGGKNLNVSAADRGPVVYCHGNPEHYRLRANAKSLSEASACVYL